jgi:hypothetical protein
MVKLYAVLFWGCLFVSVDASSQYCTAVGPYYGDSSYLLSFNLTGESATAISYSSACPGVIYLNDQTWAESVTLDAGTNYNASAGFGTCGFGYAGVGQGWIDYNQNQIFEPAESIGMWSGTPPVAPANWNFTVPAGAINGTTRMRVVQNEGGFLPLNPCATFWWGSAVDFTVVITGGVDCSGYVGQNMGEPRIISALPYAEDYSNNVCYFNEFPTYQSADVFYRILPQALGVDFFKISLCGSAFDTYLTIVDSDTNVLAYNDDAISCPTSSELIVSSEIEDTIFIIVQGWGNESGDYSIDITEETASLDESPMLPLTFWPNPAKDRIEVNTNSDGSLLICDMSGKVYMEKPFAGGQIFDLNISNLGPGVYLMKMHSADKEISTKLIVE